MKECFAVIAGGGTAGHVYPGLAAAKALVLKGHPRDSILYVGSNRGIEQDLIPPEGFELVVLAGEGIPRRRPLLALKAIYQLLRGIIQGFQLLRIRKPRVVLALGGFACFPIAISAAILRIPVVVHEQNAVAGLANRIVSRWARHSAISYEETLLRNPIHTGNPVRQEIIDVLGSDREEIRNELGIPKENVLCVVTGGSLGAHKINTALVGSIPHLKEIGPITIYHIVGRRDWGEVSPFKAELTQLVDYRPVEYEYDMPSVLRAADLVISRAGGSITAEISALGLPAILIPLSNAPGDHQTANANSLVTSGSARLLSDSNCDSTTLAELIKSLIENPQELEKMQRSAQKNDHNNASELLADVIEKAAL
ncbi:MAG: undecaprenyldiphospho-muramoylpentapeptide beta-N-acetylglucosaminyltransferase [Acidimicrobiaceae bacterium]|nr:undecaprenyldiphospho-muramoylpentapeptide beta-N-acetylglucosaminyltransferase [Acidimicrobiaceae bacterium]